MSSRQTTYPLHPLFPSLIISYLTTGCVPSDLKMAIVAPLFKKPTLNPSDVTALCVMEALRSRRADSLSSVVILLDLSTAFEPSDPPLRLCNSWIASYLAGRSYQVVWRGSVSAPRVLTAGVPLGLGSRPSPLFSIHHVTQLRHILSWSLLSLLCG